jgi:gamma-glutamyl hercynylcysteine S-oxide hydrolase
VCRHLAYLGPPVALRSLLFDAPHALERQAQHPRHQHAGTDNPDGWGVAWGAAPFERYRSATSIWDDDSFAGDEVASSIVAAARWATPGSVRDLRNAAPFISDQWVFSLNGFVSGFRDGFGDQLRSGLSERRLNEINSDTDSAVVFALVLDRLDAGAAPGTALTEVARIIREVSPGALNLLLSDGESVAATAIDNSLFLRAGPGVLIASEPLDDDGAWEEIDNGSLVENDRVTPIRGLDLIGESP